LTVTVYFAAELLHNAHSSMPVCFPVFSFVLYCCIMFSMPVSDIGYGLFSCLLCIRNYSVFVQYCTFWSTV